MFQLIDRLINRIAPEPSVPGSSPSPAVAMDSPYDLPRWDVTTSPFVMADYRRKVVGVKALQIHTPFQVTTEEGVMKASAGDYLCEGVEGERYPCKRAIFEKLYEAVQDPAPAP